MINLQQNRTNKHVIRYFRKRTDNTYTHTIPSAEFNLLISFSSSMPICE